MLMTEATPMTMPSVVSAARSLLPIMPFQAVKIVFSSVIIFLNAEVRKRGEHLCASATLR